MTYIGTMVRPRPRVQPSDIDRMAHQTLLSYGPKSAQKYSKFWILLTLAGVIATAGVVADSTATVIGAMIVAPLMTPILGTAFALVLADRRRMARSFGIAGGGALLVIALGFLFATLEPLNTIGDANTQIASRVHPRLIDLVAALATGTVGAFALVRSDVADTLPGVAIAISLVPPLAVVGITLEEGSWSDAFGAAVLFVTNVTAIVFTATMVLMLYQVRQVAEETDYPVGVLTGRTLATVTALVLIVSLPLAYGTWRVGRDSVVKYGAASMVNTWAEESEWDVVVYDVVDQKMTLTALGPPPQLDPSTLRAQLDDAGYSDVDLEMNLVVGGSVDLPGPDSSRGLWGINLLP